MPRPQEQRFLVAVSLMAVAGLAWPQTQGAIQTVSDLSIEARPLRPKVLVQESLQVTTLLRNHGPNVLSVPAADGPSPFVYELRPTSGDRGGRIVSEQLALEARSRGTPPPVITLPYNLGPGGSVARQDDPAAMAINAFEPATYALTVSTKNPRPLGPSPVAKVQVVAPKVIVSDAVLEPNYDRRMAFANAEDDGSFGILALTDDAKRQRSTVFSRANTQDRMAKPDSIAVSVPTGDEVQTQWVAWTSGGTLFATTDWGRPPARTTVLSAALPGASGRLLSSGYFFEDGAGLFVVRDGEKLHAFRLSSGTLKLAWSEAIGASDPHLLRIRYAGGPKGDGVLQLIAVSSRGGHEQLSMQAWTARDGREVTRHVVLAELEFPVVAWFLPVMGTSRADQLRLVLGPTAAGKFECQTFGLDRKGARGQVQPISSPGAPAREWAVTQAGNGKTVVATRTDSGALLMQVLPEGVWKNLANDVRPGYLSVYADFERAWAEWLDPAFGFRSVRLPTE